MISLDAHFNALYEEFHSINEPTPYCYENENHDEFEQDSENDSYYCVICVKERDGE